MTSLSGEAPSFGGVSAKQTWRRNTVDQWRRRTYWSQTKLKPLSLGMNHKLGFWKASGILLAQITTCCTHDLQSTHTAQLRKLRMYLVALYLWLLVNQRGLRIRSSESMLVSVCSCCCADCWSRYYETNTRGTQFRNGFPVTPCGIYSSSMLLWGAPVLKRYQEVSHCRSTHPPTTPCSICALFHMVSLSVGTSLASF